MAVVAVAAGMGAAPVQGQTCGCTDIALVIDDTGSMGGAIANVAADLGNIIGVAQSVTGGDVRMSLVTFKDNVEVDQPFTADMTDVENAVMALSASGGGGEPEASDEALRLVVTGSSNCTVLDGLGAFRAECRKIAILVTDALPGGCDDAFVLGVDDVNAAQVAQAAAQAGILISAVQVLDGVNEADEAPIMMNYATTSGGVFATVPSNGSGLADAVMQIIENCGSGSLGVPAPALSWPALGISAALLGATGFWIRRRKREDRCGLRH